MSIITYYYDEFLNTNYKCYLLLEIPTFNSAFKGEHLVFGSSSIFAKCLLCSLPTHKKYKKLLSIYKRNK